jgi:drug/metabolite transporter (DMT)-like permease
MFSPELFASLIALCAALSWGAADFSGGIASKRANVFTVVLFAHGTGLLFMVTMALIIHEHTPTRLALLWGTIAGLSGAVGLLSLYRALAIGKMGINAPVAAVITAVLPVGYGVMTQGWPKLLQIAGFAVALLAIWLIALPEGDLGRPKGIGLAMLAGVGFSGFLLFSRLAGAGDIYWPLAASRLSSMTLITIILLLRRPPDWRPTFNVLPYMIVSGILDSLGNALFVLATHRGRLDVAAVLSSLYPASTVVLAWIVLKERASRLQLLGMALALISVAMIASA